MGNQGVGFCLLGKEHPSLGEVVGVLAGEILPSAENDVQILGNDMLLGQELIDQIIFLGEAKHLGLGALSSHPAHSSKKLLVNDVPRREPSGSLEILPNLGNHGEEQLGILLIGQKVVFHGVLDILIAEISPSGVAVLEARRIRPTGHDGRQIHGGDGGTELRNGSGDMNKVRHN